MAIMGSLLHVAIGISALVLAGPAPVAAVPRPAPTALSVAVNPGAPIVANAGDPAAAHAHAGARPDSTTSAPADSVLDLAWLERAVLERNPRIEAARAAWREAEARASAAGSREDPMLDVMVAPGSLGSDAVDPAYRVGVSQPIPLFGKRGLRRRAASAEGVAASFDLRSVRLDLLREARWSYFEYFRIVRGQEITEQIANLMREVRRVALARYASGTAPQPEPLLAESEIGMLSHRQVELDRERRAIAARLKALLHAPQQSTLAPPPRDLAPLAAPSAAEGLDVDLRKSWPEVAAAEARIDARRADLSLARRERLPDATLGVAYDRFWNERELRTTVGLSIPLPIATGRRAANQSAARAALERAEAERAAAEDEAHRRIEESAAGFHESLHDVEIMRDVVVPTNERALKAVRAAYESGRGDFLTLLNATRDWARARLDYYQAITLANQAHAELLRALAEEPAPAGGENR